MKTAQSITVLGAGAWGTALALLLARHGHTVTLWGKDEAAINEMREKKENARYLPGVPLTGALEYTADMNKALSQSAHWLVVVPSHAFESVLLQMKASSQLPQSIVWASKGLEPVSKQFFHSRVHAHYPFLTNVGVLSGPSFAKEVAAGAPTAVVLASDSDSVLLNWSTWLRTPTFRVYSSQDVVGVELGGVMKNILAVAAGISDGLQLGANARAALLTRGVAEMMHLGIALGGKAATFTGLSGLGDLILTATDDQSRNRRLGLLLAKGETLETASAKIGQVVEGAHNVAEILSVANLHRVELPITTKVYEILYQGLSPQEALRQLLSREQKEETP